MTFDPFAEGFDQGGRTETAAVRTLQDVLAWLDSNSCHLEEETRPSYRQAVRKAARLMKQPLDRVPACRKTFLDRFPLERYDPSWGVSIDAVIRWRRYVSAAIHGATGVLAAQRERRARLDGWAALLGALKKMLEQGTLPFPLHENELIAIGSAAETARGLDLQPGDLDPELSLRLYRAADSKGKRDVVLQTYEIMDRLWECKVSRLHNALPRHPLAFVKPERTSTVHIPEHLEQELASWVHIAARGAWSITDRAYTDGVSPRSYFTAVRKILTTAESSDTVRLADLDTIAAAFDGHVLVAVVQQLRDWNMRGCWQAITPRTARSYLESLVPFLERNGEDASTLRDILKSDRWLASGRATHIGMAPHVKAFCRRVVTNPNARLEFLSLSIKMRGKAISLLRTAKKAEGAEAERLFRLARRYGTCAAFAALETSAVPARVSNVLAIKSQGESAWLELGHRKCEDGYLVIPADFVKNRKEIAAPILAADKLRGLETLRWYEKEIRPLFASHRKNDYFFPAIMKNGEPLPYATFLTWWAQAAAEFGFPSLNPHMFRHGQASIIVASNPGNWALVAARLGDTEAMCRKHYAWIDEEKLILEGQRILTEGLPHAA